MNDTTIKNFTQELETIEQFENYKNQKVLIENCDGEAFISKSKRDFQLSLNGVFNYQSDNNIKVNIDDKEFIFKSVDFKETMNEVFANISCQYTFDIDAVFKGSLNKESLFKMFFFDNSKQKTIFKSKLETLKYSSPFDCVRLDVNKNNYDITHYKNNANSYFVIENLEPRSLDEFERDSYTIQKGIGFLIGYMPGGENYIFSCENFIYRRLSRKSLKSIFYPVTSNPYSKLYDKKDIAEIYYGKLTVIPTRVISEFLSQLHKNEDFSVAIIFLMEVSSLKSVVSMPGVFSVILESLANCITIKQNKLEKLITDKDINDNILYDLNTVLDKYASKIESNAEIKIRRRLSDFNKPINYKRLTNAEKLREPFDQLKIKLSREDEKAIDYRNDLLHGNILMNNDTKRSSQEIDNHMLYISAKLYTLISKLILKKSGYNGYVINHAKFYENNLLNSIEDYFEEI